MELTQSQKIALAQRISDEFSGFIREEYQYQIENMKDNDELSWEYRPNVQDGEDIKELVIDLIAVPVQ